MRLKKKILVLVSKHEIEKKKFSFSSRTRDQKRAILVPVSRIEKAFSSHTEVSILWTILYLDMVLLAEEKPDEEDVRLPSPGLGIILIFCSIP